MSTLLLGGSGMLGHALQSAFMDYHLTVWDQADLDITNLTQVREKILAIKPKLIINAAAYTNVDQAETDRAAALAVNETGVRNVAQAAKEVGATLVHYSTDYVFPGDKKEGYEETDVPGPAVNVYGASKLAGEAALKEIAPKYYLLRTAWLYGAHGKNFVDTMLELGRTRPSVSVVNDQFGSPTFTKDLAAATRDILDNYEPGIYHAVNGGVATWYDFAREIFKIVGMAVKVEPVTSEQFRRPAPRPKYSILRNTRGPQLRSWQAALDEYLKTH